ncbi:MAG: alpha/beta hydrolase [Blautia sp.]|nr:alpha/beta hydrolase [Blautia sp.]
MKKKLFKILKCIALTILILMVAFLMVRAIGKAIYNQTPEGGINESMYVEIGGTKQWISIYGEDLNNPVLLYLHGGPGSSTSAYDYAFTRKWADVYTVVTWDQRNCGKSYDAKQNDITLTYELMMNDGLEMTQYLLDYLDVEKITLLGHSWGSYFGSNLVLTYPQYYDCYIGTGQLVDMYENEVAFKEIAGEWATDDKGIALVQTLTPENMTEEHFTARNLLMEKYGYDLLRDGTDYNMVTAMLFNPYYSISDWSRFLGSDYKVYADFLASEEFEKFSLLGRYDYEIPYYNINGDQDFQTNYQQAQAYFDEISAPYKRLYLMEDTTHGLLESKSEKFSEILHQIANEQREN